MASCPKTNEYKATIRKQQSHKPRGRTLIVHATDSILETRDNLRALGISYEQVREQTDPHEDARMRRVRQWGNETSLLCALDASALKYERTRTVKGSDTEQGGGEIALDVLGDCLSLAYAIDPVAGVAPPATWDALAKMWSAHELLRVVSVGGVERRLHAHCQCLAC
jgi:hypothetical protein